jgi:hypothetical protein
LNVWIDTLAQVLIDAGLPPEYARHRAEDAILQIQGALILGQGLDETGAFERVIKRLPGATSKRDRAGFPWNMPTISKPSRCIAGCHFLKHMGVRLV